MFSGIGDKIADIFESLFQTMWDWLVAPFKDLQDLEGLIFGKNVLGEDITTDKAFGIFELHELENIYQPGMNMFMALAVSAILIGIILSGMRIASSGINPSNRTYVFEFMKDIAIVAIVLFNLSTVYTLVLGVNYTIVGAFDDSLGSDLAELDASLEGSGGGILGWIIIQLCLLGLSIWANFYYMMRKLTLIIFMIIGPLMVALYLIPQTKNMTLAWFKEFVGTVFVQSIHAALFWIVSLLSIASTGATAIVESVILYIIFIPTAEALRSLLGMGGGMTGTLSKAGAMFGMSALAGVYGAAKGALGDKSVMGTLRGAYNGTKDRMTGKAENENDIDGKKALAANTGTDSGTTSTAERMLKPGQIVSKMGKAAMGMAGSFVGAPMGPVGSMMGSTAGFVMGGAVGGAAGRLGAAGLDFAKSRLSKGAIEGAKSLKDAWNADSLADDKLASEIADSETSQWMTQNKDSFMKDMEKKYPDAHPKSLEGMWDKKVSEKRAENLQKAQETVGNIRKNDGQFANARELADQTANQLTNDWAKNNKQQFMDNYEKNNPLAPNASESEKQLYQSKKDQAWSNALQGKKQQFSQIANDTAKTMSNGLDPNNEFISKKAFANHVASNVINADKESFTKNYKLSNPNASQETIDAEFRKQSGSSTKAYIDSINSANDNVKGAQLFGRRSVNTPYLTSQLASMRTAEAKTAFMTKSADNKVPTEIAEQQWQKQEAQTYQANAKSIAQSMPREIKLDRARLSGNISKGAYAIASFVGTGTSAATGNFGLNAVRQVGNFISDSKTGKVISATAMGASIGLASNPTLIDKGIGAIAGAFQQGKIAIQTKSTSNPVAKQEGFRNAISYTAGIIGGTRGYQAGSRLAMKVNPYNNAVRQQTAEIGEINHLAQKVDDGYGNMQIAPGAVQLVTSNDQSYIQVRDVTGQTKVVSRYGTGDSTLKKGEVVYQDLDIQGSSLVQQSSPYKLDSSGGRVNTGRTINVNPNRLVANRNTPKNPIVVQEVQSLNQQVDSGQWTIDDVIKNSSNIRMVVTKERSYMVATDRQSGSDYRVSPYGSGDARLTEGVVQEINCEVRHRRILKQDSDGYYTSLKPEELIPPVVNKRLARRREFENLRHKSLGGSN